MERLTMRTQKGEGTCIQCLSGCSCDTMCGITDDVFNKLAEQMKGE